MDQTLSTYLPLDRRHALVTGVPLLERTQGAVLFADIAGFTPLTEALTQALGPRRGVEELPRQLNLVYDTLIQEVDQYGGSVIGFAGDAITCWFDQDTGLCATACGLAMQEAMSAFTTVQLPSGDSASLAVKVAVAVGAVRRLLVGNPRVQLLDVLAGATLTRMAAAEHVAEKGEVVLDEHSAHALQNFLIIHAWRTDESGARFAVVVGLRKGVSPQPWAPLSPGTLRTEELRPWLLPTVYERLQRGQGEFLTELRPAVALFLRFSGIDYDADPDAGHKLDQYIRWVQSLLVQYEGTLIQLTIGEKGSYLYAAFGAPIAHEDDARRAALAALKLRTPPAELAFISESQIGLTRGTMRTGAYGGTTRRTYGSLSDEVNLAARLMQAARPGQIIASKRVQSATDPLFTWQPLDEIRVKGKTDPIPIFALIGARRAATIHLQEPSYTRPMVGRGAERALVEEKLQRVLQNQGQLVGITAEAGMGKSRLVAEIIRRATAMGLQGYGGECHSFGTNTPYLVWQPLWRAFFALDESQTVEEQQQTLQAELARLRPALLPRLPLLGTVLNLPMPDNELTRSLSAEQRKQAREALLVDVLKARAALGPLLLVLEDAHWLDALSRELLDGIARTIWNLPVLIVLAYRPPDAQVHPAPQALTLPYSSEIALAALTAAEAMQLIDAKLTERRATRYEALPLAVVEQLMVRTEGNPFYIEELLNYLHEQGLDLYDPRVLVRLDLPTSLHALILSRIDQLTEPQKITIKVASIIGRLFRFAWLYSYYPALGDADEVKSHLEVLRQLELTPLEQSEPELTYLFKHIVTQEVAYESLSYATRATLHEQFAAFIERQAGEGADAYLDLLAYHYERSENLAKKCHYLRQAGEAAQSSYANGAAQSYYERLLPLLEEVDDQLEIHFELGTVLERVGAWEETEGHYQVASHLALPASHAEARSTLALGKLYYSRGQYEEAEQWLGQALAQWEALPDGLSGVNQTLNVLGLLTTRLGEHARARGYLERSCALCQTLDDQPGLAQALFALGRMAADQADLAEAQGRLEESLALWQVLGDKPRIADALSGLGLVAGRRGDTKGAYRLMEESLVLRREVGEKFGIAQSLNNMGSTEAEWGNYGAAYPLLEESLTLRREMGDRWGIVISLMNLGVVSYRLAEYGHAARHYGEALALAHEMGEKFCTAVGLAGMAAVVGQESPARPAQSIRLLAATKALKQSVGIEFEPMEQALYDEALAAARVALSEGDFAAAWAEGAAMSVEEAVVLALARSEE